MSMNSIVRRAVVGLLLMVGGQLSAQLLAPAQAPAASLDRQLVPAAGRQVVILEVERFGRYAVTVHSAEGVSLQLVDRMAGPGEVFGVAGAADGRLDLFLDRGEYQIVVRAHERASGEARLELHEFAELSPQPAPQLVELKPIAAELRDFEQRSYWIEVTKRSWLQLEGAGRALVDLRLWQDGSWLHDARPEIEILDPVVGQPLLACRMVVELEPGLYLLSAYGGAPQAWAEDGDQWPFYLRAGIPRLAQSGRARFEMSPFGYDRYLVPARANFYRLELAEQRPAALRVLEYDQQLPFAPWGDEAVIAKDSREPMAEIDTGYSEGGGTNQVVVTAAAGEAYILQHFELRDWYDFNGSGDYWVSSVHAGHAEDSVDATGVLVHWLANGRLERQPLAEQTIAIGSDSGWATRCNLLDTLSVFLSVADVGTYTVESTGVEARFRMEPFLVDRPDDYQPPAWQGSGSRFNLDSGLYVLSVDPVNQGILEMVIKPSGLVSELLDLAGFGAAADAAAVRGSVRFPSLRLERTHQYRLYLNRQPGVRAGLVLRPLPLALAEALPLSLRPGRQVELPVTVSEESLVEAVADDGSRLEISINGGPWRTSHRLGGSARHTVAVRNPADGARTASVQATPLRLRAGSPLPPLPQASMERLPDFSVLEADAPFAFDLDEGQRRTFLVNAPRDALYRLASTGLLDTRGTIRSRTLSSLAAASDGGSGRNFLLHQYLLAGDYQLNVAAEGSSAGHLGVALTTSEPVDGGALTVGQPARRALAAGASVVYRFSIAEEGEYRLRSMALGRSVRCRLEDGDGWPLVTPDGTADIRRPFAAGDYRLVVLPEAVPGRRVTVLEKLDEAPAYSGHGPHQLPLDQLVEHRWLEPADGGERHPDSWLFVLPAASSVRLEISPEMAGRLVRNDVAGDQMVTEIAPRTTFSAELAAGEYRLELVSARVNNLVDYRLRVVPEALMVGMEREFAAPTVVPVAVGAAALVEISSFGADDVAARLLDDSGAVVARGDDRPGDWNFLLDGRFEPGAYGLELAPVGAADARTTVRMASRQERREDPRPLPFELELTPADDVVVVPLLVTEGDLLVLAAHATDAVGLAVEGRTAGGAWRSLASRVAPELVLELPRRAAEELRLRVWSVDRRPDPVVVQALAVTPRVVSEEQLAGGVVVEALPGLVPATAVLELRGRGAGVLRASDPQLDARWSPSPDQALAPVLRGVLPMLEGRTFLALAAPSGRRRVAAQRELLAQGRPLQLPIEGDGLVRLDLAPAAAEFALLVASAAEGQPTVRLVDDSGPAELQRSAVELGECAALRLDGRRQGQAQLQLVGGAQRGEVTVSRRDFATPNAARLAAGTLDLDLAAGDAAAYILPAGSSELRLALTPGVAVALTTGNQVESLHWGGRSGRVVALSSAAERLLVLATEAGQLSASVVARGSAPPVLAAGQTLERRLLRSGRLWLPVAAAADDERVIHVAGEVATATLVTADGRVLRGRSLAVGAAHGALILDHRPGLVSACTGPLDDATAGLWQGVELPTAAPVTLPLRRALAGVTTSLVLSAARDALLTVEVDDSAVVAVVDAAGRRSWIAAAGELRHQLVQRGEVQVNLRGFAGASLGGSVQLSLHDLSPIAEGLGEERLLAPGAGCGYRFTLPADGRLGLGVRSDPDLAMVDLVDAGGGVVGHGVVQMHELEAGDYVLVVRAPADGPALVVQPALVGLHKPSTGPPEDVIREYLNLEGRTP